MTLEALLAEIESRSAKELAELQAQQEREVAEIRARGQAEIDRTVQEIQKATEAESARLRARELASAELKAKRLLFEAEERRLEGALGEVRSRLGAYTRTLEYPKLLAGMVETAQASLGNDLRLRVRPEDIGSLPSAAQKLVDRKAPLEGSLGGLVAETKDGSRAMNMSFEELLRLREDRLREILAR